MPSREITLVVTWESTHVITVDDDVDTSTLELADDWIDREQLRTITPHDAEFVGWRQGER